MSDDQAFTSRLRILPRHHRIGEATTGDPGDPTDPVLARLRRFVVEPVVASLLREGEVDALDLRWGTDPLSDDVRVYLVARGEPFEHLLHSPVHGAGPIDAVAAAQNLAWQLEDFIAESRFAWGEQRVARYELPAPD